jgi:hypothetical protein
MRVYRIEHRIWGQKFVESGHLKIRDDDGRKEVVKMGIG